MAPDRSDNAPSDYEKLVDARCELRAVKTELAALQAERKEAYEALGMLCKAMDEVLKFVASGEPAPAWLIDQCRMLRSWMATILVELRKEEDR